MSFKEKYKITLKQGASRSEGTLCHTNHTKEFLIS